MKTISKKITANTKYNLLLDRLPLYNWSIPEAALSIGYTKQYAYKRLPVLLRDNVAFCIQLEAKKQEIQLKADVTIDFIVQELKKTVNDLPTSSPVRVKALELLGKYKAMFADRQIIETPDAAIDQTKREQAKRLSILLLQAESTSKA